jgi:hypothetical protein
MTVRGVKYLNNWVGKNVPPLPTRGDVLIRALAQKLRDDASIAGFTIADLEIEGSQVEQFIRKTILQTGELGIPATI